MDTKWTKYKFSRCNKALCVVAACILAGITALNVLSFIHYVTFFGESGFSSEKTRIYSIKTFYLELGSDLDSVFRNAVYETDVRHYQDEKEKYVENALEAYKAAQEKCRISSRDILTDDFGNKFYIPGYHYGDGIAYYYEGTFFYKGEAYDSFYYSDVVPDSRLVYQGDDGYYYSYTFSYDLTILENIDNGVNFGHTDKDAENIFSNYFDRDNVYELDRLNAESVDDISNIKYYAESNDGNIVTNAESKAYFVDAINSGNENYIIYDRGTFSTGADTDNLDSRLGVLSEETRTDIVLYVIIDPHFSQQDKYSDMYSEYKTLSNININMLITESVILLLFLAAFAVVSVRLAGNTEDGVKTSVVDKIPIDLLLALTGGAVAGLVIALVLMTEPLIYKRYGNYEIYNAFVENFMNTAWFKMLFAAAVIAMYLLLLNFAAALARNIKAGSNIFKNSLIFMLFRFIFNALKIIVKGVGRFFKKTGRTLSSLAFKPQKLDKSAVAAVLLFTLYNALSIPVIILLMFVADGFDYGFSIVIFILIIAMFITADVLIICKKVIPYIKSLDLIITASEKREPLTSDTEKFPESLKILAGSLEATNAELQKAVLKAVKDEHTKTELITNVSHDLKTPLTSVINYIDLLKKCDIEDETAKKYMEVIDDKSIKLKRLIEDLIEASKVASGNVTINKTKLDLGELATQAIVEETPDIEKNNLKIVFEEATEKHIVFADGTKIYRVFENLLSNARKYSAPGTRVYARVYSDSGFGYFEIKNISKEPLNISADELTERFVRGDKSRSEDGNGLGLSIAKELCTLNGGELILTIDGDLFKAVVKLPGESI